MKSHYFYLSQGVTRGPLNKEEVIQLIQSRQLHGLDLVLKETSVGIEDWKAINEMSEFAGAFREVMAQEEPLDWVVLVRRSKGQYLQNGPFSTKDVRNHLREGRLRYTDYIWKKGMSQWARMTEVTEFKSKKKSPKIGKIDPLEDVDSKETLPAIPKVTYAKKTSSKYKANPFLADEGKDIDIAEAPEEKKEKLVIVEPVKEELEETQKSTQDYLRPFIFEAKKKNYWMLVASVALLLGVFWAIQSEKKKREMPQRIETKTTPQENPKEDSEYAEEAVQSPAQPKAPLTSVQIQEPKKIPTQIGFSFEKDFIRIHSNGSRHYPIKILIVGLPGELQQGRVWLKSFSVRPEKGVSSISIPELKLVPGNYRIRVSAKADLKIEKELAYASEGKQFLALRNKNRKEQSYWYQSDRMRLALKAARLRDAMIRYSQQKKTDLKFLQENEKASDKIFYFEWEKYTELKGKSLRLSQKNKAQVQVKDLEDLKTELDNLSQSLGLLSVWR